VLIYNRPQGSSLSSVVGPPGSLSAHRQPKAARH
jgi:hypothetical protein